MTDKSDRKLREKLETLGEHVAILGTRIDSMQETIQWMRNDASRFDDRIRGTDLRVGKIEQTLAHLERRLDRRETRGWDVRVALVNGLSGAIAGGLIAWLIK